jgi:hypothetical protein
MGLQANEFYTGMNKVQRSTRKTGDSLRTIKRIAVAAFVGWGINRLTKSFLEAAVTTEQYQTRLIGLLGSVEEGTRLFKLMNEYAAQTPFEFEKIMGSATALAGVMRGGADEIAKWMPMVGDLAAATGLSIEIVTQQVIRMFSAGAASADLFREKGVLAMMGFQAGVSYSAEQTREMMMAAWTKADSQFGGMTERLRNTWAGTMSMFRDMWFKFRNMVMENDAFEALKASAQRLLNTLYDLERSGVLERWAESIGKAMGTAINWIEDRVLQRFSEMAGTTLQAELWQVQERMREVNAELEEMGSGSVGEAVKAMFGLSRSVGEARAEFEQLEARQDSLIDQMLRYTTALYNNAEAHTENVNTQIENLSLLAETTAEIEAQQIEYEDLFVERMDARTLMYEEGARNFIKNQKKVVTADKKNQRILQQQGLQTAQLQLQTAQLVAQTMIAISEGQSKELFYIARTFAIVNAVINAWLAYTQALAHPPGPPTTIPIAMWTLGSGLAAAALIAAQTFVGHQEGGWVQGGSGMRDDVYLGTTGRTAHMAMGGEFVVNKESAAENAGLLEAINTGGTFGDVILPVTIELDGEILWTRIYKATRDGHLQIHKDALAER